jgi:hypothetical protein
MPERIEGHRAILDFLTALKGGDSRLLRRWCGVLRVGSRFVALCRNESPDMTTRRSTSGNRPGATHETDSPVPSRNDVSGRHPVSSTRERPAGGMKTFAADTADEPDGFGVVERCAGVWSPCG